MFTAATFVVPKPGSNVPTIGHKLCCFTKDYYAPSTKTKNIRVKSVDLESHELLLSEKAR